MTAPDAERAGATGAGTPAPPVPGEVEVLAAASPRTRRNNLVIACIVVVLGGLVTVLVGPQLGLLVAGGGVVTGLMVLLPPSWSSHTVKLSEAGLPGGRVRGGPWSRRLAVALRTDGRLRVRRRGGGGRLHRLRRRVLTPLGLRTGLPGETLLEAQVQGDVAQVSRALHAWRRGVGVARPCMGCGYDRQGLPRDRPCPECGVRHDGPLWYVETNVSRAEVRDPAQRRLWWRDMAAGLLSLGLPLLVSLLPVFALATLGQALDLTGAVPGAGVMLIVFLPIFMSLVVAAVTLAFAASGWLRMGRLGRTRGWSALRVADGRLLLLHDGAGRVRPLRFTSASLRPGVPGVWILRLGRWGAWRAGRWFVLDADPACAGRLRRALRLRE